MAARRHDGAAPTDAAVSPSADCDLGGRGVLVTRPAAQADGLCGRIEAIGGRAVRFPTIEILPPADPAAATARLAEDWDIVIFISRNAVEGALSLPGDALRRCPARLAAVGRATAAAMQAAGMAPSLVPATGFDSEALLAVPALHDVAGSRVLIVRGEGGRELLAATLAERGAEVAYAEVYRRAIPAPASASQLSAWREALGFITATSDEVLDNLLRLVPAAAHPWLKGLPLAVLSARNAAMARELGFARVAVAPQPGDDGMLAALCSLVRQHAALEDDAAGGMPAP
jgi:uroporphyrinogen-III synthase